jgi:hypothetical protein
MTVQDVIDAANTSELMNVYNKPEVTKNAALINWINQGIIAIAKKIPLVDKEKVYALVTDAIVGNDTYELPEDCLQVIAVYGEQGKEIPLNDESDSESVFVPSFNRLLIPGSTIGGYVSIVYSAKPEKVLSVFDTLPVNEVFLECLLAYISYKAYKSLDSNDSTRILSATYSKNFHTELAFIVDSGMYGLDGIKQHSHFDRGGWV